MNFRKPHIQYLDNIFLITESEEKLYIGSSKMYTNVFELVWDVKAEDGIDVAAQNRINVFIDHGRKSGCFWNWTQTKYQTFFKRHHFR
jgi:S-formylglutathione hydrolase FrmB